jgi:hypothetical protein
MRPAYAALLLAIGLPYSAGQAQTGSGQDKVRYVTVYGEDRCPRTTRDAIVICSRRPESERLRIPRNLREPPPSPESESWSQKPERLERMGRTAIDSCSPVGPGAGSGCLLELIKKAREERQAMAQERAKAP